MRFKLIAVVAGLSAFAALARCSTVAPIPESAQGALALKIIDGYDGQPSASPLKVLRVIYFTPADRDPVPQFEHRLEAILEDLRDFYRDEMMRNGFGPRTFELERDSHGKFIIHLIKGKKATDVYADQWKDRRKLIGGECEQELAREGIQFTNETVAIVCNLANWDPQTHRFTHPSPYSGNWSRTGGFCWLMDSPILNLDYLGLKEPIVDDPQFGEVPMGRRNSMFIGSIGHELGHAFGAPHSGERRDEKAKGKSLMGAGNLQYRLADGGAFLTMASSMRLAARPLFRGSDKGFGLVPKLKQCELTLSTNVTRPDLAGRPGAFRLEGTVKGTPPVYGVIAYFDSIHDDGYESPTATAVPDADGKFSLEISDLEPCTNGELFVSFCHANGTTSGRSLKFAVSGVSRREREKAAAKSATDVFINLLKQHKVPGFENGPGSGNVRPRVAESLDRVALAVKVKDDAKVYHYTMRQNPQTGSWELEKGQGTDGETHVIEDHLEE